MKIKDELINKHRFYEFKMKQFLLALALGMRPANLYIQLEVPDAVLALQEAVFIFLYGTFLQTCVLIKEVCKDLRTGFVRCV